MLQDSCAIQRILGSTVRKEASEEIASSIKRLQFAVGVPMGGEIIVRTLDMAYEEGKSVVQIDSSNAFNNLKMLKTYEAVVKRCPKLTAYYRWYHEKPISIINGKGEEVITRESGVLQGNNMAGDYFSVSTYEMLEKMEEEMRTHEALHNDDYMNEKANPGSLTAFYDDIFLAAVPKVINSMADRIEVIMIEHGGTMNKAKSGITGKEAEDWDGTPVDWPINTEGTIVLGAYIGNDHFKKSKLDEKVEKLKPPTQALQLLKAGTQYALISKCISQKLAYSVRTARNMKDIAEQADIFDRQIGEEIARIAQTDYTGTVAQIIKIPKRNGCLGVTPTGRLEAEAAIITSRIHHKQYMATYRPDKLQQAQNTIINAEIVLGESDDVVEMTGIEPHVLLTLTTVNAQRILGAGKKKVYTDMAAKLVTELGVHDDTRQQAAFLLSASGTTASTYFLGSSIGSETDVYFPEVDWILALRRFFGVGIINNEPEYRVCACGESYTSSTNKYHAELCMRNQGLRTTLHNLIVALLYRLLKKMNPQAGPEDILTEQNVGQIVTPNPLGGQNVRDVRADIIYRKEAQRKIIDVAVANPVGKENLAYPIESHKRLDAAAMSKEKRKRNHYRRVSQPTPIPETDVIPFVLETTGRLGPSALLFLHSVCGTQTYRRTIFINECALLCARYAGKILSATRTRFSITPQNGG